MNIDHHLQQSILEKLAASDVMVRYSNLKEGDIENSLFSYHLNKLIDRGMVEKKDDGYILSVEGARWLKDNGSALKQSEQLRVFVALVVQNEREEFLVGQRSGQFKTTINDYISPSAMYTNDADLSNQVDEVVVAFIPADRLRERVDYGFVQIKASYNDGAVLRSLFHLTFCKVGHFEPQSDNFAWLSREQIATINHPSATILRGIIDHIENPDNENVTPTIAG